jgi:hypothetical protein
MPRREAIVLHGVRDLTAEEAVMVARLRKQGKPDTYIRGWIIAGRPSIFGASKPKPRDNQPAEDDT